MESSPTARALTALELIQNVPGISGERLGMRLGVSDRAARRYVGILRDAGIPIESTPGRFGGYRVGRGFRLPPLMFSTAEALALVMAALEGTPGGATPDDAVGSALTKIIRVLPTSLAGSAEALRQVSGPAVEPDSTRPDPETTAVLVQSAAARRRLRIRYELEDGRAPMMDVDPWAVGTRRGRWYLLCWSHTRDARRVLRVDRVASVEALPETFSPPEDLDPVRVIEEHLAGSWRYEVELVIDAPLAAAAQWVPRSLGRLEPIDEQRTRLLGTTDDAYWYCQHLVGIQAPFHVLRPDELRVEAGALGRRLLRGGGEGSPVQP